MQALATLCPPLSTESAVSFLDVQNWGKNEARSTATSPHVSHLPGSLIRYLSHRRFHVMLSALDPWVWNPANPYVRHHWKFQHFWGVDFCPPQAHAAAVLLAASCLQETCLSWGAATCSTHVGSMYPGNPLPLPTPLALAGLEQPKISVPWLCSTRAGVPAPPGHSPPAARCSQHAAHRAASARNDSVLMDSSEQRVSSQLLPRES